MIHHLVPGNPENPGQRLSGWIKTIIFLRKNHRNILNNILGIMIIQNHRTDVGRDRRQDLHPQGSRIAWFFWVFRFFLFHFNRITGKRAKFFHGFYQDYKKHP